MKGNCNRAVAQLFSRAAGTYDQVSMVQLAVGKKLVESIPADFQPHNWLDLGCGTGMFCQDLHARYPAASGVALDLAPGMLGAVRSRQLQTSLVCADAASLPLQADSLDLIFSNFTLQWCTDILAVLQQAYQALRPGGLLVFSSVLQGSLEELADSWRQVDGQPHINRFRLLDDYRQGCSLSGWQVIQLRQILHKQHRPGLKVILQELKQMGASHLRHGRGSGLLSRQRFNLLEQAYEKQRAAEGLPVSWQVAMAVLRKPQAASRL